MFVLGGYTLASLLHQGSETVIYRGTRTEDGAAVVAKLLRTRVPGALLLAKLRHEHAVLRGLDDPAIVRVHELVEEGGQLALIMEDLGGLALSQLLRTRELGLGEALLLAGRLVRAVVAIHAQGLLHRDLKPQNFIVHPDTLDAKVIDFGLATRLAGRAEQLRPEALAGTLAYMSPEQTGRTNLAVDQRSDLYSLGMTLYQLFTRVHPFDTRDPLELVHAQIARIPPPMHELRPGLPPQLSRMVAKLLAKDPDARYQTAHGLLTDLNGFTALWQADPQAAAGCELPLAWDDRPARLRRPGRLLGQGAQERAAQRAFQRVQHGDARLLALVGPAGVGKSAFTDAWLERLGALRCATRCDPLAREIPYAPIVAALRELTQQLLATAEAEFSRWRVRLGERVGEGARVLIELIPELDAVLGPCPPLRELAPGEARGRFYRALRDFLQSFTSAERPLLLALHDLQWADPASVELLRQLLEDPQVVHVLVVASYREHEVSAGEPVHELGERLRALGRLDRVEFSPLGPADAELLVADMLASAPAAVAELARLIYPKTLGNPFFIEQFLENASERGLLVLDAGRGCWGWDADGLAAAMSTDNVVELMLARLRRLPGAVLRLLQVAACVGHRFELRRVAQAQGEPLLAAARGLAAGLASGLIVPLGGGHHLIHEGLGEADAALVAEVAEQGVWYRFSHDRVQQAAHDSLAAAEREEVHLRIGASLRPAHPETLDNERLFELLAHLNHGAGRIAGLAERRELARLNLLAGLRAREAVAFEAATLYLRTGLALLAEDAWEGNDPLRFALGLEALTCASLYGSQALDEEEAARLVARASTAFDRARVDHLRLQYDTIHGRPAEAIAAGLRALAALGIVLPADEASCGPQVPRALQRVRALMGRFTPEQLLARPELRDPAIVLAVRVLADLSSPVNLFRPNLYALVIAMQAELGLRHGHAAISSYSYMVYAYHLATTHGALGEAQEIGRFALALLERRPAPEVQCKTRFVYACFAHLFSPLPEVVGHFQAAHAAGLATGDGVFLSFACSHLLLARLDQGELLGELRRACEGYLQILQRTRVASSIAVQQLVRQYIACLQGRTHGTLSLSDDEFDDEAFLAAAERSALTFAVRWQLLARLELLVIFGHDEAALAALGQAERRLSGGLAFYFTTRLPLLAALTLAANGRSAGAERRAAWLPEIERHHATLAGWAEACPQNYAHMARLVEAELCDLRGDLAGAARGYDVAIGLARAHGFVGHAALAQERCGLLYLRHGLHRVARLYLREAHEAYQAREMHAKARQLIERHGELLRRRQVSFDDEETWHAGASTGSSNPQLDITTAFKAAQALASEMQLERLLAKVVPIAVENTGAERGALLLQDSEGGLGLAADFGVAARAGALPMHVARAVHRSGAAVLLGDAAADAGAYREDPYIREHRVRSLLCAPLAHQGKPLGVLYLENSLSAGVFTSQHLQVVHLLATQAAIAIENASLYAQLTEANRALEQRVAERTVELTRTLERLQAAQRQLVESEKMAALGTLVAGVAHEINTPVGVGVTAASLLHERSEAVKGSYEAGTLTRSELERYLDHARQSSAMLLTNLNRAGELIQSFKQVAVDQTSEERREFPVRSYIEHVLLTLHPELRRSRHQVLVECAAELRILSYPGAFSQILTNLILNALVHAFAPEDRGTITIGVRQDGERLVLDFRDDGRGIEAAHLPRIFDPFFTTRRDLGGSGLGLHIVYNIVTQRLGGTIVCASAPGQGTRFTITWSGTWPGAGARHE